MDNIYQRDNKKQLNHQTEASDMSETMINAAYTSFEAEVTLINFFTLSAELSVKV